MLQQKSEKVGQISNNTLAKKKIGVVHYVFKKWHGA